MLKNYPIFFDIIYIFVLVQTALRPFDISLINFSSCKHANALLIVLGETSENTIRIASFVKGSSCFNIYSLILKLLFPFSW